MAAPASRVQTIFISYRRLDAAFPAGWLYEQLVGRFGRKRVFKDVDSIQPGEDFVDVVVSSVESCQVVLAVIGPAWLSATDAASGRRIDDPDDVVRIEIETALRKRIPIIPVLVLGARMPARSELPAPIAELAGRNAVTITPNGFTNDLERLVDGIKHIETRIPARASARPLSQDVGASERKPVPIEAGELREFVSIPAGRYFVGMTTAQIAELSGPTESGWRAADLRRLGEGRERQVEAFRIAKYPVTNADFATFIAETGRLPPRKWHDADNGGPDHPAVWVSLALAEAYVGWRSTVDGLRYRLPSPVEWEVAARGGDRRRFPWGDEADVRRCHVRARTTASVLAHTPGGDSPFGVSDMVGNAREWTSGRRGGGSGDEVVSVRGGGFIARFPNQLWCSFADWITTGPKASIGFRLALSVDAPPTERPARLRRWRR